MRPAPLLSLIVGIASSLSAFAANWPAWRGPTGDGVCTETNLPLHWSATEQVKWKTPLPERGNSTPVVWGNRVFITQAIESEGRRTLMCFDRTNGKLLWQSGVTYTEKEPSHPTNPHCSASPATDGERIVVSFGSAGLYCYDFTGKKLWHRDLGKIIHIWGNAASPVLSGDRCFLNVGPGENTSLTAFDKRTGKTLWQHLEPGGSSGEDKPGDTKQKNWIGSWSDPIVRTIEGQEELLMNFPGRVCAFDPATGKELWTCAGLNPLVYTSPIFADGIAVGMGGYNGMTLAVHAGGNGDITTTRRLWHNPRTRQRIGSGVIRDGYIYILEDPGIAQCSELKTGKIVWEERLKGAGPTAQNWSSLVLSGDRLYAINQGGDAFVFKASPQFELLATNPMGEKAIASIAASDGELFIRTYGHLWCIGGTK